MKEIIDEKLIKKLYDYLNLNFEEYESDIKHDYLTENTGRDGNDYYYYYDGTIIGIINIKTKEIITDEQIIEELF